MTALGAIGSLVLGDFSSLLASVPVFLGQASYSRQAEQEADAMAVTVLRNAHISPAVMATMFEKLAEWRRKKADKDEAEAKTANGVAEQTAQSTEKVQAKVAKGSKSEASWLGIAFASHPPDDERIQFFRDAAVASRVTP